MSDKSHPAILPSSPEALAVLRDTKPQHYGTSKLRSMAPIGEEEDGEIQISIVRAKDRRRELREKSLEFRLKGRAATGTAEAHEFFYAAGLHAHAAMLPLSSFGLAKAGGVSKH